MVVVLGRAEASIMDHPRGAAAFPVPIREAVVVAVLAAEVVSGKSGLKDKLLLV